MPSSGTPDGKQPSARPCAGKLAQELLRLFLEDTGSGLRLGHPLKRGSSSLILEWSA